MLWIVLFTLGFVRFSEKKKTTPKLITTSAAPKQPEAILFSQKARVPVTDISSHTWSCSERISMVIALFWKGVCYGSFLFNTRRRNKRKKQVWSPLSASRREISHPTASAACAKEVSAMVKAATPSVQKEHRSRIRNQVPVDTFIHPIQDFVQFILGVFTEMLLPAVPVLTAQNHQLSLLPTKGSKMGNLHNHRPDTAIQRIKCTRERGRNRINSNSIQSATKWPGILPIWLGYFGIILN